MYKLQNLKHSAQKILDVLCLRYDKFIYRYGSNSRNPALFSSFLMGGFESASHINGSLTRLDMIASTQHDIHVSHDYAMLKEFGIKTIRDGIRWPLIDDNGTYDFSSLLPMLAAARDQDMQVIWTLCHYGWPSDIDIFSPEFVERFAAYCSEVASFVKEHCDTVPFYTPINEISFFSWAAGEVGYIYPFAREQGHTLKIQLVKAAIAGMEAILRVDDRARFVHVEPLINIIPPLNEDDLVDAAATHNSYQFQAFDMLSGGMTPELGGHVKYLDIIGCNFYSDNQWEHGGQKLYWHEEPRDKRWLPLHTLLKMVHHRYDRPMILGETSHVGGWRVPWMNYITHEIARARYQGVPIEGVCLYPIIDRPDWDNPEHWHNSGLWDLIADECGNLRRVIHKEYELQVRYAQRIFKDF